MFWLNARACLAHQERTWYDILCQHTWESLSVCLDYQTRCTEESTSCAVDRARAGSCVFYITQAQCPIGGRHGVSVRWHHGICNVRDPIRYGDLPNPTSRKLTYCDLMSCSNSISISRDVAMYLGVIKAASIWIQILRSNLDWTTHTCAQESYWQNHGSRLSYRVSKEPMTDASMMSFTVHCCHEQRHRRRTLSWP